MINTLYKIVALLLLICPFAFIISNIYLSIKLKTKKYELIRAIASCAPEKFKDRVFLIMNDHMPWVAGSAIGFIWFSYPMLRFVWGIQKNEIVRWKLDIKNIFGHLYPVYLFSITCANLGIVSIFLLIIDELLMY
uniref:Uncharacterized protein n=1 Tax=Aliivibrio wodanis TaxID=80852 RepID=A0A5Q4Z4R5_9GAMM|nr:hypothetical protein AW0309160_03168 [Aliivibrio wodanis]